MRVLAVLALLLGLLAAPVGAIADAGGGAILTVTGSIEKTNRPPFDPFEDALFNSLEEKFERAFAFSRADLASLPQAEMTVRYPNWPRAVSFRGPLLKDVLAMAGASTGSVTAQAIDGYAPSFTPEDLSAAQFVLAIEADGKPLPIGGHGPVWLVFPPGSLADQAPDSDAGVPWAVFHLRVEASE